MKTRGRWGHMCGVGQRHLHTWARAGLQQGLEWDAVKQAHSEGFSAPLSLPSLCILACSLSHAHADPILMSHDVQFSRETVTRVSGSQFQIPGRQIWPTWSQHFTLSFIRWRQAVLLNYKNGHRSPQIGEVRYRRRKGGSFQRKWFCLADIPENAYYKGLNNWTNVSQN